MSVRNASLIAIVAAVASAAALGVSGCGKSPAAADGVVTITQTTTTTVIPDLTASGVNKTPSGTGLAAATLFTFSLQNPPSGGVPPYTVSWDFGDGSAPAVGETGAHKYLDPGDFTATVTVTDSRAKSVKLSMPVTIGTVSGDWGIDFARVVARQKMDIIQNGEAVTAAINGSPDGSASGGGGVSNPRSLSLSVTFADAVPPYTATFVGTLDETLQKWTGTATGYRNCPCDFVATR